MKYRMIGESDLKVSSVGLGCMVVSPFYGETNEAEAIDTIQKAYDLGVNFFDTADLYGFGHSETVVGKAIKDFRREIILCTKGGLVTDFNNEKPVPKGVNTTPAYLRRALESSLQRLGTDYIDLYYLHRIDPVTPIEETLDCLVELIKEGKIRHIGLSEATSSQIIDAHAIYPITAVQSEYSLWFREPEKDILKLCQELNIGFVPFSPLGRGFLTGDVRSASHLHDYDFRKNLPRFAEENIKNNLSIVDRMNTVAKSKNCSLAQLALAWLLHKDKHIVPIPGTVREDYLIDNCESVDIQLTAKEMKMLDDIAPEGSVSGDRFSEKAFHIFETFAEVK